MSEGGSSHDNDHLQEESSSPLKTEMDKAVCSLLLHTRSTAGAGSEDQAGAQQHFHLSQADSTAAMQRDLPEAKSKSKGSAGKQ